MRKETDSIGIIELQDGVLYGSQAARAKENFALDYRRVDMRLIYAAVIVKKAAALTYQKLGIGDHQVYNAVIKACDRILAGEFDDQFVTDALQGGAGTSTNMNVNEVVANVALLEMGHQPGEYEYVHPLDDVNRGQSTNDVIPTALRIATINGLKKLTEECADLEEALKRRGVEFADIQKLGRTEMMDAVPITLGHEFSAFGQAISRDRRRLHKVEERLLRVNIGGTAVGLGDNADQRYRFSVVDELRDLTCLNLAMSEYPMDSTQNNDVFVEVSGVLKALAVNLKKIANDLRLMNSGPHGGFGEIKLAPMQAGSTIMPSKVNPVIPEMTIQVAFKVMANDMAITLAASHGEFELNAFEPLIADCLLQNIDLLTRAVYLFRTRCVEILVADRERCRENLENSYAFATSFAPQLGYDKVASIIKENDGIPAKIKVALEVALKELEK